LQHSEQEIFFEELIAKPAWKAGFFIVDGGYLRERKFKPGQYSEKIIIRKFYFVY
jgi:hypothetical protein